MNNMAATHNTNVVFIDTNLDTHLALVVSDLDTVSDLKKSILSEHPLCFPKIGQIQIHGMKVKRKGYFYHLSDSMIVRSAFSGCNKGWFVSVDASVLGECAQTEKLLSLGSPNQVACLGIASNALIGQGDNATGFPSKRVPVFDNFNLPQLENKPVENEEIAVARTCVSECTAKGAVEKLDGGVKLSGDNDTGIPLPGSIECEVDGSGKGIADDGNVCGENSLVSVPSAKMKRKSKRKKGDTVQGDDLKDDTASVDNPLRSQSKGASCVNNKLPGSHIECKVDGTNKGINDACIVREEENCKSVSDVKKKQTSKRKKEDTVQDGTSKVNDVSAVGSVNYTIQQDIVAVANPSENADKEVIKDSEVLKEHQRTDCNNNNTKNDIDAAVTVIEASEPEPAARKRRKKRKRSSVDSKEVFNVETTSQKDEVQKSDEAPKERKESKDQFEHENKKSRDDVEDKHDKVSEDILDTIPPAKKKKRSKEKSGEKSLSNTKLINDLNVDNASHHVLEDQQKIKNSNADQSAEHFNDTRPLKSSVRSRRGKGKLNSSNPPETPVVISSKKDEEVDCLSTQRGVQEEITEDGLFSKDITVRKAAIVNTETGTDACKEGIQSTKKGTGNYKNHFDIEIQVHTSDVDEPMELTEDNKNVVLDQCHENETCQIEGAEQGREVSPQNDPKLMLLEKSTSSNQDNTDANIGELNVTSDSKKPSLSSDSTMPATPSVAVTKKSKTANKKSTKKSSKTILEPVEDSVRPEPSDSRFSSGGKVGARDSTHAPGGKDDNLEASSKTLKVNVDQQFSFQKQPDEANLADDMLVDKMNGTDRTGIETMAGKSMQGLEAADRQIHAEDLSSSQQLSSKEELDVRIRPSKKVPNVHRTRQDSKLSGKSDSAMSLIGENRKSRVNASGKSMNLEKPTEHFPVSNSKVEGSIKMVQNKAGKASRNNVNGVVSKTEQKKSLLAGAIFPDDSSSTSEDEVDNSDASTRSPSYKPLLSDFSDGDSSSGSHGGKSPGNGGRSSLKASFSDSKGISIDKLLRSSSRFKKARTTVAQLPESESQPEVVPDSLPE